MRPEKALDGIAARLADAFLAVNDIGSDFISVRRLTMTRVSLSAFRHLAGLGPIRQTEVIT